MEENKMGTQYTRRTMMTRGAAVAGAAGLTALGTSSASAADTKTWRMQTLWQPGTATQLAFERFAENVGKMTSGEINIVPLAAGSVVGVTGMIDAVNQHILDGHHSALVYWTGLDPAFAALGDLNAAYDSAYYPMEFFYKFGGLELLREVYRPLGLFPIGVVWWGVESIPTTRRVSGVEDLAGLKIRLPQGMSSDIFSKFGAVPVNLAGSEVFSALDNGTIEATDWGTLSMNDELGFGEMAKFAIYPGIHSCPVGDVTIRLEDWEALDEKNQKILESAVQSFGLDLLQTLEKENLELAKKMPEEGIEIVNWSQEERKKFRSVASEVWREYAEKNESSRRAIDEQIAYLKLRDLIE